MTRWLLNCDDVGMHPTINRASCALLSQGLVKACSVMPVGRAFDDAVDRLRATGFTRVGVHLALQGEYAALPVRPAADPRDIPGLVDAAGCLRQSGPPPVPEQAEIELRAQVARVILAGLSISHLDGHMFFYDPGEWGEACAQVVENIGKELGVPVRRRDQISFIWEGYDTAPARYHYYDALIEQGTDAQLLLHPADSLPEMATFSGAGTRRVADFAFFSRPDLPERFARAGIETCGWSDV